MAFFAFYKPVNLTKDLLGVPLKYFCPKVLENDCFKIWTRVSQAVGLFAKIH